MIITDELAEKVLDHLIAQDKVWGVMVRDIKAALVAALADVPDVPEWVEQLAGEWELEANESVIPGEETRHRLRLCADELRQRARGKP